MPQKRRRSQRFPETRWSLVKRAAASDERTRQQALTELLVTYMPGLRAFLVETRRVPADLADDLLHGFVADKILAARLVRQADQGRGKFRNYVLKSLNNFVTTKLQREYAARATAAGLDETLIASPSSARGADRFEQEWVQQVVRDSLQLMQGDCKDRGRADLWDIFRLRVVEPMLNDAEPVDYGQIVQRFGIETPRQAMNLLANAKRCFLKHLRSAVGKYASGETRIDEEIADLRRIVGR